MILVIGEILFDTFPDYRRLGGAPFNFAYHLGRLGFEARFWSRVGYDEEGRVILDYMKGKGIDASLVQKDTIRATGNVLVSLDSRGNADYDILADAAYDGLELTEEVERTAEESDLIYFGSLVQRTPNGFAAVQGALNRRKKGSLLMYDINLRKGCYDQVIIEESLRQCHIFKLNEDELGEISRLFSFRGSRNERVRSIMDRFGLNMVSLTSGAHGSYLYTKDGREYQTKPEPGIVIKDTVGAGDAYAAMLCAGLLGGWEPQKIVDESSVFAGRICEIQGAVPEQTSFYDSFL